MCIRDRFIQQKLNLSEKEAKELQTNYFYKYNTSLNGLMIHHKIPPQEFLKYVHTIDLSFMKEDTVMRKELEQLDMEKFIFTNGSAEHAQNILTRLGIYDLFGKGLISGIRVKDERKGWFVYRWRSRRDEVENFIENQKKNDLDNGILSGYGVISMCEVTNPSPLFYGVGGAHISSQDGASIRLEGSGAIHLSSSITEQGQGTEAIMKQIAADQLGVSMESIRVTLGDTDATPYGGGTWASRGAGIGGEAVLKAARILKDNSLSPELLFEKKFLC